MWRRWYYFRDFILRSALYFSQAESVACCFMFTTVHYVSFDDAHLFNTFSSFRLPSRWHSPGFKFAQMTCTFATLSPSLHNDHLLSFSKIFVGTLVWKWKPVHILKGLLRFAWQANQLWRFPCIPIWLININTINNYLHSISKLCLFDAHINWWRPRPTYLCSIAIDISNIYFIIQNSFKIPRAFGIGRPSPGSS
jgi:hypothetical protein